MRILITDSACLGCIIEFPKSGGGLLVKALSGKSEDQHEVAWGSRTLSGRQGASQLSARSGGDGIEYSVRQDGSFTVCVSGGLVLVDGYWFWVRCCSAQVAGWGSVISSQVGRLVLSRGW